MAIGLSGAILRAFLDFNFGKDRLLREDCAMVERFIKRESWRNGVQDQSGQYHFRVVLLAKKFICAGFTPCHKDFLCDRKVMKKWVDKVPTYELSVDRKLGMIIPRFSAMPFSFLFCQT